MMKSGAGRVTFRADETLSGYLLTGIFGMARPLGAADSPRPAGEPPLLSDSFKYPPPPAPAFPLPPLLSSFFSTMEAAIAKLAPLGFRENDIRDAISEILQAFDNDAGMGWRYARENNYKMVVNMLRYKRMKEKQERNKVKKNYVYTRAEEKDYAPMSSNPTKCFGMNSDEED